MPCRFFACWNARRRSNRDISVRAAVVNAAGGIVCDMKGKELLYNKMDLHNPEFLVFPAADEALFGLIGIRHPGLDPEASLKS